MDGRTNTVVIGAGQGGLATSYHLSQRGREHVVLEKASGPGNAWRSGRWDSFTLVTPNWSFRLPGFGYQGNAPNGFMPRDEIVARFEQYAAQFHLPVRYDTEVTSVEQMSDGRGYLVRTDTAVWHTRNVVVATGLFQRPRLPSFATSLSSRLTQIHSGQYKNPRSLPDGSVLVVGSAQSGCQIAEELYQSGRKVHLSVGSTGRVPRRYRGKDVYEWSLLAGLLDRTVDKLPSPEARFAANAHLSGRDGGHTLNLHQFARDGVVLLGRLLAGEGNALRFAPDLKDNLKRADRLEAEMAGSIDKYIEQAGLSAPPERLPDLRDGYDAEVITELDLRSADITTIIWAIGYSFDFNFVKLPAFDSRGFPVQKRGVTDYPGLFFVGLPWLYKQKSGLLVGVGEDAEFIASAIASADR